MKGKKLLIKIFFLLFVCISCTGKKENSSSTVQSEKADSSRSRLYVSVDADYTRLLLLPDNTEIYQFGLIEKGMRSNYMRVFKNENMVGLFPDSRTDSDDWLLFFANTKGECKIFEKGRNSAYRLLGKPRNCDKVFILFITDESNWLASIDENGNMGKKMFFEKSFTPDTVDIKYDSNDAPQTIILDSIDEYAEYSVNLQANEITLKDYHEHSYNDKP